MPPTPVGVVNLIFIAVPALSASAFALASAAVDPLKSEACAQALTRWEAAQRARAGGAEPLRQAATQACLGGPAPAMPMARSAQPPAGLGGVATPPAPANGPARTAAVPVTREPVRIDRPSFPTHCDPGGCWDAGGRRLRGDGAQLQGPSGACLPQVGGFVCP